MRLRCWLVVVGVVSLAHMHDSTAKRPQNLEASVTGDGPIAGAWFYCCTTYYTCHTHPSMMKHV